MLFDLAFCSEVAYAVPSHPSLNVTQLTELYDSNAAALYKNFSNSLQQIACNATLTAQYSLARSCSDCAAAYKQWLCAVTIPRCQDFSSNLPFLLPRNTGQDFINGSRMDGSDTLRWAVLTNSSRNPIIDAKVKPGPYKEVLPCKDLCYDLVQSCPAVLGYACPEDKWLSGSNGVRSPSGDITCSYLGAAYFLNTAWKYGEGMKRVLWAIIGFWVFWKLAS